MYPVMSTTEMSAEYTARILLMQKSAMKEAGDQAVKLIQSAAMLPPSQGHTLDVSV
jgi:hypothetical protein